MTTEESPLSVSTATTTSLLDKPLHQLTEDDISQLTREDCRRYLKQKGMRRPSWNKSQAIQQVIMLKALLEPKPDCSRKVHITHRQQETPIMRVEKGTSADTEVSVSADESVPGQRNDADLSDLPGDDEFIPTGIAGVTDEAKGQMTIFYSGMVNVYDDVPAEKAWTLFQLAAIPLKFSQEAPFDGNVTTCHLQAPNIKASADSSAIFLPTLQTVRMTDNSRLHREESSIFREDNSGEGSASRKASVQRYLEKRKDRYKSKRKAALGVYLSHQIQNQNHHQNQNQNHHQNEQQQSSSRSYTCSPPPIRPPNTPNRF